MQCVGMMCSLGLVVLAALLGTVNAQTINDRLACTGNVAQPGTRVNTTGRLAAFRAELAKVTINGQNIESFIVLSEDAHNSEYPTEYDQRRGYISGFTGSAGKAVITATKAALWTDGRYHDEADEVLDCNWLLMKEGLEGTPTISEWINSEMTGRGLYVGIDEALVSNSDFQTLATELSEASNRAELRALTRANNPVDRIWTTDRPAQPNGTINALKMQFTGLTWQQKVVDLRAEMTKRGASAFAVTALDEIAWLFNLRGSDINYNPFFLSYALVQANSITLYILDKDYRLTTSPTDNETDTTLATHLGTGATGACNGASNCVEVKTYDQDAFEADLTTAANSGPVWVTYDANYAVYQAVVNNRIVDKSPIALAKSIKNEVERTGMKKAYDRDSVALIKFLAFLEQEILAGNTNNWTEVSAAAELDRRRSLLTNYRGLSFETISGYGSNGAIIHYRPSAVTNKVIGTDTFFLLDSGALYLDGTTDVTRTMHYGTPTAYQKECYTRVLMGAVSLATVRFPTGLYGFQIDSFARASLWNAGLVYKHGTGHGIGAYLSVHEGPGRIYGASNAKDSDETLRGYQYFSDEPGYYETNNFGIRLETIVMVQPFTPAYSTADVDFLEFTPITLVPFETNLIDYSMMTTTQVEWLNSYNQRIRNEILPLLEGDNVAINWVNARIQPMDSSVACGTVGTLVFSSVSWMAAISVAFFSQRLL